MYRFLITYENMDNTLDDNKVTFYLPYDCEYKTAWEIAVSNAAKLIPGDNYDLLKIELIST